MKEKYYAIIITIIFLVTYLLGFGGIYPFASTTRCIEDLCGYPVFSPLVKIPAYPLFAIVNFLDETNFGINEGLVLLFAGIILIAYYYYLSKLVIWVVRQIHKRYFKLT